MKKKIYLCGFLLGALFFVWKSALAVDDPVAKKIEEALSVNKSNQESATKISGDLTTVSESALGGRRETVADIRIHSAEISEIKKNQLKLVFDVGNSMEPQSDLIYGLELIKEQAEGKVIIADVKNFPEDKITIEKNKSIHRELVYQSPEYLNGDYILWLKIKDESGLTLAVQSFKVNLAGTGRLVEQGIPCYLTIENDKNENRKYTLMQGVDLKKEEKLFLNCQTRNFLGDAVSVLPTMEFYQRDFYGKKIKTFQARQVEPIFFAKDEEKLTQIAIPLPENPQAYDVKIVLQDGDRTVSNPILAHFVLSGKSGTIINASLDKNQYSAGENAQLTLLWTGPADTFRDSRTGGSFLKDPSLEVEFKDAHGVPCGEKSMQKTGEFKTVLNFLLEKTCVYPIVTIKLVDDGQVLYEKIITTEPEEVLEKDDKGSAIETNQAERKGSWVLVGGGSILILLVVLLALVYLRRKNSGNVFRLFFFFLALSFSFVMVERSQAYTDYLYGDVGWMTASDSYLYGANWVPMSSCGLDPNILPQCPWNYWTTAYCKFNNNAFWYSGWWSIVGCYQDIVGFTYGLSGYISNSKLIRQGSTLAASGIATGINMCNNGVTAGIVVDLRNTGDVQWVLGSTYFSDNSGHVGYYGVSTAGWSCASYTAKFAYAFKHGWTSNVAVDYTRAAQGAEGYSVVDCCSQTCATGPGCRSSLANGIVASGTCCGGTSCFQCKSNYYWNGSMCVADCSTWGLALGASPNSGSAPLSSRLTSSINSIFGGENYSYSGHSCGSGGPVPTSISGGSFTCNYSSAGTYYPSVTAVAQTTGCAHSASSTVSVSAPIPNPTATLSASPTSVSYGGSSTLTWTTSNATSCWLDYFGWVSNTGGSVSTGALTTSRTYGLQCYNSVGVSTGIKTATVSVAAAPTATLSASPTSIPYGGSSTLTWTTSNATSCWLDYFGWVSNTGGSVSTGALTASRTYGLQCYNSVGVSTGIKTATVSVAAAPTATLSASPTSVPYGGSSTLTWTTSNATSCWLDYFGWVSNTGGSVSTGALTASRTFNLTCYNGAGSPTLTQSVSVTIIFSCTGSDPANADLCPGDDTGLSAQTAKSIVASCGAPKCEYVCKSTYIFDAGSCRLKVAGQCGSAKGKSFCGAPTADLCSPGTPSAATLSSNKWSWYCTNDGLISSECTARKECSWSETIN